jgi:hypothetical protein
MHNATGSVRAYAHARGQQRHILRRFLSFCASRTWFGSALLLAPLWALAQAQMYTPGQFAVRPDGSANYTIPIQVPPGTAGMQPNLALAYNSHRGNGPVGMGWSLSGLSSIHRCARTYVQDGFKGGINLESTTDRLCLDGQRLILVSGSYAFANSEYRTETESFSKVVMNDLNNWTVYAKSGQIMHFRAIMALPPKTATPLLWVLDKISDRTGNYLTVSYSEDRVNGEFLPHAD